MPMEDTTEVEPDVTSYNCGISTCGMCRQWQAGLIAREDTEVEPDVTNYNCGVSTCEKQFLQDFSACENGEQGPR